jgi:alpha-glucosidase
MKNRICNDMNEPALDDRQFGDPGNKIWFPLDAPQGDEGDRATHAETHNLYGLMMAKACADGLHRHRPAERSFVLTRSGYAGVQRWSSVWMGDNQSLWDYLEMSLPMLCNMGLSGVAFVGCDIGGFAGNATAEHWTPPARDIIVEVVGVGEQRFADDGAERRLVF